MRVENELGKNKVVVSVDVVRAHLEGKLGYNNSVNLLIIEMNKIASSNRSYFTLPTYLNQKQFDGTYPALIYNLIQSELFNVTIEIIYCL